MIPKIIWQTHNYKKEHLAGHHKRICANWINLNPGWDYRYVSHIDREIKVKQYPELYEIYLRCEPMYQADIWRYIVTYEEGGVYADMDSLCIQPLDEILNSIEGDHEVVLLIGKDVKQTIWNGIYAAKEKSNTMKAIIDQLSLSYKNQIGNLTYNVFYETILKSSSDLVFRHFGGVEHSFNLKRSFPANLNIYINEKEQDYENFVYNNSLRMYYD
jgi:mannosyltransferase OCH1-like enzyme